MKNTKNIYGKLELVLRIARRASLAGLTVLFLSTVVSAQTTVFSFGTKLPNEVTPTTDTYEMEFRLFDAAAAGNQIGATNVINAVDVKTREFNVWLDFGAAAFPGADRYTEISLRRNASLTFTVITPRERILSVPYAIRALNATTADNALKLNGVDASGFVQTTDPRLSDSRDPNPGSSNYIQNTTISQTPADFNISGSGTANIFNTVTQYNIGGSRILSNAGMNNTFGGVGTGPNNNGTQNSFFGSLAGNSNQSGGSNSFFGYRAGVFNFTGAQNSYFGNNAGSLSRGGSNSHFGAATGGNGTGGFNSFFGMLSGAGNTAGENNSFIGYSAGTANTTGGNNIALGANANVGANDLTFATAIGAGAVVGASNRLVLGRSADDVQIPGGLFVNGTGGINAPFLRATVVAAVTQFNLNGDRILSAYGGTSIFVGVAAGSVNTTGARNSFFGVLAGSQTTNGAQNSFFGAQAGNLNSTGDDNAFFGNRAGSQSTGNGNSFFGSFAGSNGAASGDDNTFVGHNADFTITQSQGFNNTLLGANAKIDVITNGTVLNFATAIGAGAKVEFSDMVVIGKAAGVYDGVSRPADIVRTRGIFQPALGSPGGSPVCFNNGLSLCSSSFRYKKDVAPYFSAVFRSRCG